MELKGFSWISRRMSLYNDVTWWPTTNALKMDDTELKIFDDKKNSRGILHGIHAEFYTEFRRIPSFTHTLLPQLPNAQKLVRAAILKVFHVG